MILLASEANSAITLVDFACLTAVEINTMNQIDGPCAVALSLCHKQSLQGLHVLNLKTLTSQIGEPSISCFHCLTRHPRPPIPNSKLSRTRPTNCILFRINHKKFTDQCTFLADSGVQFNIWVKLIHQNVNADDFSGLFETSIQSDKDLSLAATDIPLSNDWASMEGLDSVTAINRIFNQLQLKAEVFDSLDTEQRSGRRRQAQVHFLNDNDPPTTGTSTLDCCSDFGNKDIDYLEPAV